MRSDYASIAAANRLKYGTDVGRYGTVLLAQLYSDRTHFVYELLQNAEDARATWVTFELYPDRLEVRHNGRQFSESDVVGICGLVEGTKAHDLTTIGRFGIGFKSVYRYTSSPVVHSGDEHLVIREYVLPTAVPPEPLPTGETRLSFPFDHPEVAATDAYTEIGQRLRDLGVRTLLFLQHVEEIRWSIGDIEDGAYLRGAVTHGAGNRVTLIGARGAEDTSEEWLVFNRPVGVQGPKSLVVEAAFRIEQLDAQTSEQIQPVAHAALAVFFPTEKPTRLGFLIQGPYRTTPARDNVPEHDPHNQLLIRETASLVSETLPWLRNMGLLTISALQALPIQRVDFPQDSLFRPIFSAVRDALLTQPLLPTHAGGFAPAPAVKLARGAALRELISDAQLGMLFRSITPLAWLNEDITEARTPELRAYLMQVLSIEEVTSEGFARTLSADFIAAQPDVWMERFYVFLEGQEALWRGARMANWIHRHLLLDKPFIRLHDDTHAIPFKPDGSPNVYLPPLSLGDSGIPGLPIVKPNVIADVSARRFLTKLGLTEPDIVTIVIEHVIPRYRGSDVPRISFDEHMRHIEQIAQALGSRGSKQHTLMTQLLRDTPFLLATNPTIEHPAYRSPAQVYLRTPDLETYFAGNPNIWFVGRQYERFKYLLDDLNIQDTVRVRVAEGNLVGHVIISSERGDHQRGLDGFDPRAEIEGLGFALNHPTVERSRYIWNVLLAASAQHISGVVESSTNQTYANPSRETKVSPAGRLARERAWLPDREGRFRLPAELSLADLPDGFTRNDHLADQLGLRSAGFERAADDLGIDADFLALVMRNQQQVMEFLRTRGDPSVEEQVDDEPFDYGLELEDAFQQRATSWAEEALPPPGIVGDPAGRRSRTIDEIASDKSAEPAREERFTRVPARRWEAPRHEARDFLLHQYQGECQICGCTFRKRNGQPYFEGLYLVKRLHARWIDRPGNVLCLCASCCAKMMHGPLEAGDIRDQIRVQRLTREGGDRGCDLVVTLCGHRTTIHFTERHMLELQALLDTTEVQPRLAGQSETPGG
jgi:hypothetical protein